MRSRETTMTTTRRADSDTKRAAAQTVRPEAAAPAPPAPWSPLRAWRLHAVYAPLAGAVARVLTAADIAQPARVLLVGGDRRPFEALLDRALPRGVNETPAWETVEPAPEAALDALEPRSYDCVVAVDFLPLLGPSRRRTEVEALCRAARLGVVLLNPFDAPEVTAAERSVNALFCAERGEDHPVLGRHAELGLPDLDAVRAWVESFFPNV